MKGTELITAERQRQVEEKGWTAEHDTTHKGGELATAAVFYTLPLGHLLEEKMWPSSWAGMYNTKHQIPRIKQLVIAGALIAAEIDRLKHIGKEI